MFETKKQIDVDERITGNLSKDLGNAKNKFLSRRKAMKKAGKTVLGTGLVFLGLCLPGISVQKEARADCCGDCEGECTGGCTATCASSCQGGCTGGCQGGCTGGCTGTCDTTCTSECTV